MATEAQMMDCYRMAKAWVSRHATPHILISCGSPDDAVQTAMLEAPRAIADAEARGGKVSTFFNNRLRSYLPRHASRMKFIRYLGDNPDAKTLTDTKCMGEVVDKFDSEMQVMLRDYRRIFRLCLKRLTKKRRRVLLARSVWNLSFREIGERYGVSKMAAFYVYKEAVHEMRSFRAVQDLQYEK
jgi:RNA polymerase sigma factor (sigma-70 family)